MLFHMTKFYSQPILKIQQKLLLKLRNNLSVRKIWFALKVGKISCFCQATSFEHTVANFKYFLMNQSAYESWDIIFSKNEKKIFFQALVTWIFEKSWKKFSKNRDFWFFDFRQNIHQEVVFTTSKAKKSIFWMILRIFCPGKFFHTTFSFFCKSAWKFAFFMIFEILTSQNLQNHENKQISNASRSANFKNFSILESAYESWGIAV